MDEKRKEEIESLLKSTKRKRIEDVLKFLEDSGYYTSSCYTHHTYSGGLPDHCYEVYTYMKKASGLYLPADSIIITGLLHDMGKACDMPSKFCNVHGHDRRALEILDSLRVSLSESERIAILHHQHTFLNYLYPLRVSLSIADCVSTGRWKNEHKRNSLIRKDM